MPTVLITGASRGIGLEFVRQYRADGWDVIATCRTPENAPELQATGAEVHGLDVTDEAALAGMGRTLAGRTIDVLINNAGIYPLKGPQGAFGAIPVEPWMEALRTNIIAPWKVAETFIGNLERADRPVLATVSSKMGSIAEASSPGSVVYRTSKTGVNMVVKGLSIELASRGVICLALHPGWVRTDMGGPNGLIDATESVTGLRAVIAGASTADSGTFRGYDGATIPW
ncbi:SDR family oxidoreductase [Roseospira marina]|uniref:SDR family oxidoreductase n=1 Tax=Roseospira marina TaxID=140057 RepID=A0A5M6IF87_9PROT|nr:SDR family oxidoreductase [Roseospira marina]KAA5606941.1 SDR family oxidoreductase [Roseospira marina]MBB4312884.1 NAD(P)-dependent dehydrogenase (short-subunit alcohol dehydrogenase family) [Roseospira marina]MBB5086343.1 NAD(P)-dependent dehydrogenase (short-subunit alcohol dehydrogenase family) [Roseospira marina]